MIDKKALNRALWKGVSEKGWELSGQARQNMWYKAKQVALSQLREGPCPLPLLVESAIGAVFVPDEAYWTRPT